MVYMKNTKWASPENPRGLWANCSICGLDMRERRTRKNTCSETCLTIKQTRIDSLRYAQKMHKNPNYAKEQSARQYARIKSNPELLLAHKINASNYRKLNAEYHKTATKKYREQNPEKIKAARKAWILSLGDDNEKIESERKLEQLKSTEIFQVFDPNFGVRNPQAQYELLLLRNGVKKNKGSKKPMGRAISKVEVDGDTLIAGKNRINIKAILQALSDATGKNYIEL